jgi:hypothetical protein
VGSWSDALLLRDALLMHHIGMAAGSRPGDASSIGGRREPAGCSRSDALFSRDRGPDASHRNGGRQVPAACRSDALLLQLS